MRTHLRTGVDESVRARADLRNIQWAAMRLSSRQDLKDEQLFDALLNGRTEHHLPWQQRRGPNGSWQHPRPGATPHRDHASVPPLSDGDAGRTRGSREFDGQESESEAGGVSLNGTADACRCIQAGRCVCAGGPGCGCHAEGAEGSGPSSVGNAEESQSQENTPRANRQRSASQDLEVWRGDSEMLTNEDDLATGLEEHLQRQSWQADNDRPVEFDASGGRSMQPTATSELEEIPEEPPQQPEVGPAPQLNDQPFLLPSATYRPVVLPSRLPRGHRRSNAVDLRLDTGQAAAVAALRARGAAFAVIPPRPTQPQTTLSQRRRDEYAAYLARQRFPAGPPREPLPTRPAFPRPEGGRRTLRARGTAASPGGPSGGRGRPWRHAPPPLTDQSTVPSRLQVRNHGPADDVDAAPAVPSSPERYQVVASGAGAHESGLVPLVLDTRGVAFFGGERALAIRTRPLPPGAFVGPQSMPPEQGHQVGHPMGMPDGSPDWSRQGPFNQASALRAEPAPVQSDSPSSPDTVVPPYYRTASSGQAGDTGAQEAPERRGPRRRGAMGAADVRRFKVSQPELQRGTRAQRNGHEVAIEDVSDEQDGF